MKLNSSHPPIYLPEKEQNSVLRLGLENCNKEDWIYTAQDLPIFHRHKINSGQSLKEKCYQTLPESVPAQIEFHELLLQHLLRVDKLGYKLDGSRLVHEPSKLSWELGDKQLWLASLWIEEDICLLEKKNDNYVMTAASVCSPSNWRLEQKIGASVDTIHVPVPGYAEILSSRVNRFLGGINSNKVMMRFNWSIQTGNELSWRDDQTEATTQQSNPTENLYWRIERQTFIRLPQTGAIVFAIKIFLHSFDSLRQIEGFEQSISKLLARLPDSEKHYKGLISQPLVSVLKPMIGKD